MGGMEGQLPSWLSIRSPLHHGGAFLCTHMFSEVIPVLLVFSFLIRLNRRPINTGSRMAMPRIERHMTASKKIRSSFLGTRMPKTNPMSSPKTTPPMAPSLPESRVLFVFIIVSENVWIRVFRGYAKILCILWLEILPNLTCAGRLFLFPYQSKQKVLLDLRDKELCRF